MMNIKKLKIKVNYLTLYFLLILFLCGYIKNALIIFGIVIFHELGHILISIILGYKIKSIELFPFGGITKIDNIYNSSFINNFLISIMGAVFQCILFIFFKDSFFIKINLSIMIFNLLPIVPLDGSKILFEIYAYFLPFKKVIKYHYLTSFLFILIYLFLNYKYNFNNYLIISLFIYKTIEVIKNKSIIYEKFILEKMLYDIKYSKVINKNELLLNYKKDTKYYYNLNGKILSDKEYLLGKIKCNKHK